MKKKKKIVKISAREANLKRRLRRHLKAIGFSKADDGSLAISGEGKDVIRALHGAQRLALLKQNRTFITEHFPMLRQYFAQGNEVDPTRIAP